METIRNSDEINNLRKQIAKLKNANGNADDSLKSSEQKLEIVGENLASKTKDYDNLLASTTAEKAKFEKHIKDQAKAMKEEKNTHDGDNKRNSDEINKLRKQLKQNTTSFKELKNDLEYKVKGLRRRNKLY